MTAPWMFRSLAVALLAACVGLATLPGCSGPAPTPKDEKKDDAKTDPNPGSNPGTNPKSDANPNPPSRPDIPPQTTLSLIEPAADKVATDFRLHLVQGTASADALSVAFLKAVGKPAGILTGNEEEVRRYIGWGYTFVAVGSDVGLLSRGADALAKKFRS